MKLMGVPLSPFVRKVSVVMTIKGIEYEQEPVLPGGGGNEEFLALSPLGKIPVLVDGDFALADSTVICEYLDDKIPSPSVRPADVQQRARARFLEEYCDSKLMDAVGPIFVERFAKPNIFKEPCDEERASNAEQEIMPPHLDYLESQVPQDGFLFGDFCTADISLVSPLLNARYGGFDVDPGRWPRFAAFMERVTSHAPVAAVLEKEQQFLATMRGG